MASASTSTEQYHKDGDKFLNHIVRVTGDETWVSFVNVETKKQTKAEKVQTNFVSQELMATVFWDRKGVLMVDSCNKRPQ
jgi:hypothetical protein